MSNRRWPYCCLLALFTLSAAGCVAGEDAAESTETLSEELQRHVTALADGIGIRDRQHPDAVRAAAAYVEQSFRAMKRGDVNVQLYEVDGSWHQNVSLEFRGLAHPQEIIVVGAHYDTATGTPGADDNASGVAGVLALARRFATASPPARTVRFVAFGTEEPPAIRTPDMGSHHYARRCRERGEQIVEMLSIEMIGYFSDEPGSQKAPPGMEKLYPTVGNFLVFAGVSGHAQAIRDARDTFIRTCDVPAEMMIIPTALAKSRVSLGANSSDQWSFWQYGYPGMMVTDTANWRNENYHNPGDTPPTLDYVRMARAVDGLQAVVGSWTDRTTPAVARQQ